MLVLRKNLKSVQQRCTEMKKTKEHSVIKMNILLALLHVKEGFDELVDHLMNLFPLLKSRMSLFCGVDSERNPLIVRETLSLSDSFQAIVRRTLSGHRLTMNDLCFLSPPSFLTGN